MRKDKRKRKFLSLGRREFIQLGVFGAVATTGFILKKTILDPIPPFIVDNYMENSNIDYSTVNLKGNFVWDELYNLDFVQKYIDFAGLLKNKFSINALKYLLDHPFPIKKYQLSKDKTISDEVLVTNDFTETFPITSEDILLVHSKSYFLKLYLMGYSRLGLLNGDTPIMPEIPEYVKTVAGGTYTAAKIALRKGIGMNFNGGFHHAHADHESGFCYLNDVAITIKKLRNQKEIKKVLVVDLDVHHGDGNAKVMGKDSSVSIFDVYQSDNSFPGIIYPVDYGFGLDSLYKKRGVTDSVYLEIIKELPKAIEQKKPDIIIYLADADPHENHMLGSFRLSTEGLMKRDDYVIKAARDRDIPLAVVLAGGYPRDINDIIKIHSNTARVVKKYSS